MNRTAKIVKGSARKHAPSEVASGKMSVSEVLRKFDELWRIERSEDLANLKAKEQKAKELREAIASLDN